jgi:hypothetical protein
LGSWEAESSRLKAQGSKEKLRAGTHSIEHGAKGGRSWEAEDSEERLTAPMK